MPNVVNVKVAPKSAQKREVNNSKAEEKEAENIRPESTHDDTGFDLTSAGTPSEIRTENSLNHLTSDGPDTTETMTDEEKLATYTPVILNRLRGSKRDLVRVGAALCKAKHDLARGSDLSRKQELTFTDWYETTLGISQAQARLWMRWVRPILGIVNWEDDEDPILNEIASIGPHLFDEVMKLPEDFWFMSDEGILFVAAAATGDTDIAVKELSVRRVKAIRARMNGVEDDEDDGDDAEVDDVESDEKDFPSYEGDENECDDNFDVDAASDEDEMDDESDDDTGSDEGDDDSVSNNVTPSTKKQAKSKTTTKAKNAKAMTKAEAEAMTKTKEDSLGKLLNETDWQYKDFRETKMPVLIGKTVSSATMPEKHVTAINVRFALKDGVLTHGVVYSENVAFYAVKTGTEVTLHWYDHREDHWYEATVEQLPSEHHNCDERDVEPQKFPPDTMDDLETGSWDLGDLDAYRHEDTLEMEEQFETDEESNTVV